MVSLSGSCGIRNAEHATLDSLPTMQSIAFNRSAPGIELHTPSNQIGRTKPCSVRLASSPPEKAARQKQNDDISSDNHYGCDTVTS
jgi:hypothetical protein